VILNIYKEKNWTSFDVVAKLRGVLKTKRIGHAGTLDPLAEGVLIILTDADTKKQDFFMKQVKEYEAEIAFGITTPTWDLEITPDFVGNIPSEKQVDELIPNFIGEIEQTIPMYSAKRVDGKHLYELARKGLEPTKPVAKKKVVVHNIEKLGFVSQTIVTTQGEKQVNILQCRVTCSSGTYVRSLAFDMANKLGTGGMLVKLLRTKVGEFTIADAKKLTALAQPEL